MLRVMSTRNIATSTLWQIGSQAVTAMLSALSVKLVAIGLNKDLAGAYNSVYGYLQIFAILADFGLYAVAVREASRAQHRAEVLGAVFTLRAIITCVSLGTAVAIAWLMPRWSGTPLGGGIAIAALVPFFTLLAGILRTAFQVTHRMRGVFIAEVLQRVLTVGLMGALVMAGIRGSDDPRIFAIFLWIGAAGAALLLVASFVMAERILPIRPRYNRAMLMHLLQQCAPYGIAFLCIAAYRQFDLTLIALLRPDFRILNAEYGFALRLAEMSYLVPTFLLNSTLPILVERQARGIDSRRLAGMTLLAIVGMSALSAGIAWLWARPIMEALTTEAYLAQGADPGADTALRLLAGPMFLNGLVLYSFYVLLALHRWKGLLGIMLIAVIGSVVGNILVIPIAGYVGAIGTSTAVHAFLVAGLLPLALWSLPPRFRKVATH